MITNKDTAFMVSSTRFSSIQEYIDDKYGMFHIDKQGKIKYILRTKEEYDLIGKNLEDAKGMLKINCQKYMSKSDDQTNRMLILIESNITVAE